MKAGQQDYLVGSPKTYKPNYYLPTVYNPYYTGAGLDATGGVGFNPEINNISNPNNFHFSDWPWVGCVLPNCVGYVVGRISEINARYNYVLRPKKFARKFSGDATGNGGAWYYNAEKTGWKVSKTTPMVGCVVCWQDTTKSDPYNGGHVAIVENMEYEVYTENSTPYKYNYILTLSDSGYGYPTTRDSTKIVRKWYLTNKGGYWHKIDTSDSFKWSDFNSKYKFIGFIYPPYDQGNYIPDSNSSFVGNPPDDISKRSSDAASTWSDPTRGWSSGGNRSGGAFSEREAYEVVAKTREVERKGVLHTNDLDVVDSQGTQLLSYPSLVESPFVIAKIGGYTFGTYGTKRILIEDGTHSVSVQYPDYIQSLQVEKVNGSVNTYTLNLVYQIAAGADPNLVDKILSTAGYGSTVVLTYGDFASPAFIYKEEQAILTKVVSSINFNSSQISYTITAVSNSFNLWGTAFQFTSQNFKRGKPSDIIKSLFRNKSYKLQEIFYGMKESDLDSLIAGDDLVVDLEAQQSMDVLTYINYLVTCMCSITNDPSSVIRDSTYALVIHDDVYESENYTGPYFTVDKIPTSTKTMSAMNVYTVDVGYPSNTMVMDFQIHNDDSWALLYKYGVQDDFDTNNFIYKLDNNGNMVSQFSPGLTTSTKRYITTENQKTWWTSMTQHPITATLVVKGLIRPALLMSYVKINSFFYGQRHVSSGLYIITKQVDTIRGEGYRTTLSLTRISGDDAYIGTYKAVETYFERGKRIAREEAFADTAQNKKLTVEQTKDAMDKIGVTNRSEDFYKAVADEANGVNAADRPT